MQISITNDYCKLYIYLTRMENINQLLSIRFEHAYSYDYRYQQRKNINMIHNTDEGIEPKNLNNDENFRSNAIVTNTVSIVSSDKHKTDINRTDLIELREYIF